MPGSKVLQERRAPRERGRMGTGRRGRDHELQRRLPRPHEELQEAEQDVRVQRALVRFVEDHDAVLREARVFEALAQQRAVGDVLDPRVASGAVLEPDGVADEAADGDVHLVRDAARDGHRGDAPGLRDDDPGGGGRRRRVVVPRGRRQVRAV
eukprot:31468-Pelagococcus_subviridis.AAC.13